MKHKEKLLTRTFEQNYTEPKSISSAKHLFETIWNIHQNYTHLLCIQYKGWIKDFTYIWTLFNWIRERIKYGASFIRVSWARTFREWFRSRKLERFNTVPWFHYISCKCCMCKFFFRVQIWITIEMNMLVISILWYFCQGY